MDKEKIAEVCHNVNKAYCESLKDFSQPDWSEAPEWQRESAISGVQFHLDNPNVSAGASHYEWLKHKLADGWTHGEAKDADKKEHPCMVPFFDLPKDQQAKDHIFKAIVDSLKNI